MWTRLSCGASSERSSTKLPRELCGNLWDCRLKAHSVHRIRFLLLFVYLHTFGLDYIIILKCNMNGLFRAFQGCARFTRVLGVYSHL